MDDEELIENIEKYGVLYATNEFAYRNTEKKETAWRNVSEEVGLQGNKWNVR